MDGYFKSDVIGRRQHYFIYLPPCYDGNPDVRYPVVYLLHGIPMDERHWLDEGLVARADKLFGSGELPPFIIVMPHGDYSLYTDTSGGSKSFESVFVNELIPAIDGRFRTLADAKHRAIGGISRGGVWALEIAFTHPELFDAVGGHSPALSVNRATAEYDPEVLAKTASIDKLRIFLDAGDRDWTRAGTQALSKILAERYLPHTYTVGQGDHDYPYWATQVEAYLRFYGAPWKAEKAYRAVVGGTGSITTPSLSWPGHLTSVETPPAPGEFLLVRPYTPGNSVGCLADNRQMRSIDSRHIGNTMLHVAQGFVSRKNR